jgi:hypothetical protein
MRAAAAIESGRWVLGRKPLVNRFDTMQPSIRGCRADLLFNMDETTVALTRTGKVGGVKQRVCRKGGTTKLPHNTVCFNVCGEGPPPYVVVPNFKGCQAELRQWIVRRLVRIGTKNGWMTADGSSVGRRISEARRLRARVAGCLIIEESARSADGGTGDWVLADDAAIGGAEVAADDLHVIGFFLTDGPEGGPHANREEVQ